MAWAKVHTDMLGDTKLMRAHRKGAGKLELVPWLILFAKAADDDGRLTVGGEPAEPEDIAEGIPGVTPADVAECIKGLESHTRNCLVRDPDGALRLVNWGKRQDKPSNKPEAVRDRVQKHRDRKRAERDAQPAPDDRPEAEAGGADDVTPGNAEDVTPRNATEEKRGEEKRGEAEGDSLSAPGERVTADVTQQANPPAPSRPDAPPRRPSAPNAGYLVRGKMVSPLPAATADGVRSRIAGVFEQMAATGPRRLEPGVELQLKVDMAFAYWQHVTRSRNAILDPDRTAVALERLGENGENIHELLYAIDGAMHDGYVTGKSRSANGQKHDGFEFLLRDRSSVERYAKLAKYHPDDAHKFAAELDAAMRGTEFQEA